MGNRSRNKSAYGDFPDTIRRKGPRKFQIPRSPYMPNAKLLHIESRDVIDLGAPKKPRTKPLMPYVPNSRLYPGPQAAIKKDSESKPNRKKKMRQQRPWVPNPRLYQPPPRRVVPRPPPLWPAVSWQPPMPTVALETASGAALRLTETRKQSSVKLPKHRPLISKTQTETRRTHLKRPVLQEKFPASQEENLCLRSVSMLPKKVGKQPAWLTSPSALGPYDDLI